MQMELSDFTAVIGIDWADKKHDVCVHLPLLQVVDVLRNILPGWGIIQFAHSGCLQCSLCLTGMAYEDLWRCHERRATA